MSLMNTRHGCGRAALAAAVALWAGLACASQAQTVTLTGADGRTLAVGAKALADLPRTRVTLDVHGQTHVYEGPLLIDVLAKVGAPTGRALRGPALANAVVVTASDGYVVVFGLAEADPGTRPNRMILADRADGRSLGAQDGPFKVVVEGDLRPARAIRMVERIEVVRMGRQTSRPGDRAP